MKLARPFSTSTRLLATSLFAVAVIAAAWAMFVPAWQTPDEDAHFAYVQSIAERFRLPGGPRPLLSTEQRFAEETALAPHIRTPPLLDAPWSRATYQRWRHGDAKLTSDARKDGGGASPAGHNPPLYYAYEALAYSAASRGDIHDRLFLMRLWSALLLLVAVTATWFLAGEIFARNRLLQVAAAAVVGLQPMATFISASVNPDALLLATWAVALWVGVRILKRGLTLARGVAFGGVAALALLVKPTSYALVPAVLFALAIGLWRLRRHAARRAALVAAAALLALALPAGSWVVAARAADRPATNPAAAVASTDRAMDLRGFGSYVWQFYLPPLPFQQPFPVNTFWQDLPVYAVWVKGGWGVFGWFETRYPPTVYTLLGVASAVVLLAAALAVIRDRRKLDAATTAFLALVAVALLGGLHWTEYQIMAQTGEPFTQGRYLLPILPLGGLAAAKAVTLLPRAWWGVPVGLGLGALFALQLLSFWTIATRYYA